ncbi:carbohydrate ABC transporter permease [Cohnella sp. REN36]|nr:carbohydrate ABC transporter permease [Cohnella sp. REN36]MCC3371507.1 carbohydrate ABC transporter permease [Cohnella sp. REN36]
MLTLGAAVMLLPIVLTWIQSLMSEQEIERNYKWIGQMVDTASGNGNVFANLKLLPDLLSFDPYLQVLVLSPKYLMLFWNSVFLVVPIVLGQAAVAGLAAYAFARLRFPGRDKLFLMYVMTMLMPFQVTLVPNYLIIDSLGLMNRNASIILPGIFGAFGVFMMRQFMAHIPQAYAEAAKMDGAGHPTIFLRIVLPLAKSGFAALTVLLFADNWNMIEQPLLFLQDADKVPLSLYLSRIDAESRGIGFAASALYMLPMVLLFRYAESYFIEGIQQSGIKG